MDLSVAICPRVVPWRAAEVTTPDTHQATNFPTNDVWQNRITEVYSHTQLNPGHTKLTNVIGDSFKMDIWDYISRQMIKSKIAVYHICQSKQRDTDTNQSWQCNQSKIWSSAEESNSRGHRIINIEPSTSWRHAVYWNYQIWVPATSYQFRRAPNGEMCYNAEWRRKNRPNNRWLIVDAWRNAQSVIQNVIDMN